MIKKPERPSDDLPPEKAAEAWKDFLDAEVGGALSRPPEEILMPNKWIENMAESSASDREIIRTKKGELYLQAIKNCLPKLPILQQIIVGRAYGIHRPESYTQEQIGEYVGLSQPAVSQRLAKAEQSLQKLVRQEMARLVKEELKQK